MRWYYSCFVVVWSSKEDLALGGIAVVLGMFACVSLKEDQSCHQK